MCVGCYAISAMTLFTPVTEAPQSANVQPASQVQSMPVAEETRISIAKMLKQLPKSADTRILREEFQAIQTRLAGVKDDTKAEAIINDGLNVLSQRVMAQPNSDRIIEVMRNLLVAEDEPQAMNPANSSKGQKSWGWLN